MFLFVCLLETFTSIIFCNSLQVSLQNGIQKFEEFIAVLEKENELVRIKEYVDPHLEIAEITDRISKSNDGGKALLFENTGYEFPVLMNAYGSEKTNVPCARSSTI